MIGLNDKEITKAIDRVYPSGTGTYQVNPADRAIAKAQLKKVVEWLENEHSFIKCSTEGQSWYEVDIDEREWQALLEEVKE